jgi:hypothetical protein
MKGVEAPLEFRIKDTHTKFLKGYRTISWSKLLNHRKCSALWMANSFTVFKELTEKYLNHVRAIPGTIVQKMFEVFINERIYRRGDMRSYNDIIKWFDIQTRHLYDLIRFEYDDQFKMDTRYFFKTNEGLKRIAEFRDKGLDLALAGFQPAFVDYEQFNKVYRSEGRFLNKITGLYKHILDEFLKKEINLDMMLSEEYVSAEIMEGVTINGQIDFIFNTNLENKRIFRNIKNLRNNYIVLDGKYHVNKYVKEDQLHFYVCLLGLKYQKQASKVGFIDWCDAKIKLFDIKPDFLKQLRNEISILIENGLKIEKHLKDLRSDSRRIANFYDIEGIEFKPSKDNCIFCPINTSCKYYERQGDTSLEKHMEEKKKVEQHIESLNLDISAINTITI